ncbi:MAG: threonine/serine dehydratase [Nitrolancea sp.]
MVDIADVRAARDRIAGEVRQTPVFTSTRIGDQVGAKLYLKAESLQKTGSFKVRGALNRLRSMTPEELSRGVVTVSAGNHAQGLAWAAQRVGTHCTVVMTSHASQTKIAATRGYGAEVILVDGPIHDAFATVARLEQEEGRVNVHGFDDPWIIAGQGTVGLEIMEQVPDVDVIVCPVGGGGLISGVSLAAKSSGRNMKVFGVEPSGASAMRQSWDRGEAVRLDSVNTIADGLAPPMAGKLTYAMTREYVDDIILLDDDEIIAGVKAIMTNAKLYVEPSGAAATAALLAGKIPLKEGETVVSIISGGNYDLDKLKSIL